MLLVLCLTMWLTINTEKAWLQNHINITSLVNQSEYDVINPINYYQ